MRTRAGGLLVAAAVAAALGAVLPAFAQTGITVPIPSIPIAAQCADAGDLGSYDVFVSGDLDVHNSQVQGAMAAGGDATIRSYQVGAGLTPDPSALELAVGGDLTVSDAGATGSAVYGGSLTGSLGVPAGGSVSKGSPAVGFDTLTTSMRLLSHDADELGASGTATLQTWGALQLVGTDAIRNVFEVTTAQMLAARQITLDVPTGSTAIVNVHGPSYSTVQAGAYGVGTAGAATVWNFVDATSVEIGAGLEWYGTVLAPNATVSSPGNVQVHGSIWAASLTGMATVLATPAATCLPPAPAPEPPSISLDALCVDPLTGQLAMRLRNAGPGEVSITWTDAQSPQSGSFTVPAASDHYFEVADGARPHEIQARASGATVSAAGVTAECAATIRVHKTVSGEGTAPAGHWTVHVEGDSGYSSSKQIAAGETVSFAVPAGYEPSTVPVGFPATAYNYVVTETARRSAVATIDTPVVTPGDGESPLVTIDNRYDETPTTHTCSEFSTQAEAQLAANTKDADHDGLYCEDLPCPCIGPDGRPTDVPVDTITQTTTTTTPASTPTTQTTTPATTPTQPSTTTTTAPPVTTTRPTTVARPPTTTTPTTTTKTTPTGELPVAPPTPTSQSPSAPVIAATATQRASRQAADLAITQTMSRSRAQVGDPVDVTVTIRNIGDAAALGSRELELPQLDPEHPNSVARLLSLRVTGDGVTCRSLRPVDCTLGTMRPGATVVVHARFRLLVAGALRRVVRVGSRTADLNTTNNMAATGIVVSARRPTIDALVVSPRGARVGERFRYYVLAYPPDGAARFVRLCHTPPAGLLVSAGEGTYRDGRRICRDITAVAARTSAGFWVYATAQAGTAGHTLALRATAGASGTSTARATSTVAITGQTYEGLG